MLKQQYTMKIRVCGSLSWNHTDLCRPPADSARSRSWTLSTVRLSHSLPHTQIWCSPSLKPVVVVLSIVWWRAKNNSSQKKTVANAACLCPACSCYFFPLGSTLSLSSLLWLSSVQQVSFVVVEAEKKNLVSDAVSATWAEKGQVSCGQLL